MLPLFFIELILQKFNFLSFLEEIHKNMLSTEDGPEWLRSMTNVRVWMVSPVILGFFYQTVINCEIIITFVKHF